MTSTQNLEYRFGQLCLLIVATFLVSCSTVSAQESTGNLTIDPLSRFGKSRTQLNEPVTSAPSTANDRQSTSVDPIDPSRVNSINDRIKLLRKILEDKRKNNAKRDAQEKRDAALDALANQDTQLTRPGEETTESTDPDQTPVRPDKFIPTIPVPKLGSEPGTGIPMVEEPVNSFELGNSLMKTGNFEAAIKSYKAMLAKSPSQNDEMWLKCLIGCCYRLQGKYAQAESKFRELANQNKQDSYSVDYAKWSLNYIEQRRLAKAEFQSVESEMNAILEELKNDVIKR